MDRLKRVSECLPPDMPEIEYGRSRLAKQKLKPYEPPKDILSRMDSIYPRLIKVILAMCKNPTFQTHLRDSYSKFFKNAKKPSDFDPAGVYGDDYSDRCVAWLKDALENAPASSSTVRNTGAQFFLCSQLELFAKPDPPLSRNGSVAFGARSVKINSDVRLKDLMSKLDEPPAELQNTDCDGHAHIVKSQWLARVFRDTLAQCGLYSSRRGARAYMGQYHTVVDWGEATVRDLRRISPDQHGVLQFLPHYMRVSELQKMFAGRMCPSYLSMWWCLTRIYREKNGLTLDSESKPEAPKSNPRPSKKRRHSKLEVLESFFHEYMENQKMRRELKALRTQIAEKNALIRSLCQN